MIKVNPNKKLVRQTTAPYKYFDGTDLKVADIRVRYFAKTTKQVKEEYEAWQLKAKERKEKEAEAEKAGDAEAVETPETEVQWYSDILVEKLESLPDLVNEETGKPFEITTKFLDALDIENVNAIARAIKEDENPKSENTVGV